jgi:organic hydroperoxide reductase OsmC/OhrA
MKHEHHFAVATRWTGDRGTGTSDYRSYGRDLEITASGKAPIAGSSARVFHGDAERWNPEELLIAALSECHLLSYLHVAASHGVVVVGYEDDATGTMEQTPDGGGRFTSVTLRPRVTVSLGGSEAEDAVALAAELHAEAARKCFIAASVAFPVRHEPVVVGAP